MSCIDDTLKGASKDKIEKAKQLKELYKAQKAMPGMAAKKGKKKINKEQYDVYMNVWMQPMKVVEEVIARQNTYLSSLIDVLGGTVVDLASPIVGKAHSELKNRSMFYKDTVNMIRTGFANSQLADKMYETLGIAGDVDGRRINEMLQVAESVMQESNYYLSEVLPKLDSEIREKYKDEKDRVRLYQIVARTGLSNLQYIPEIAEGYLNGDMTLSEALKIAEKSVKITSDMDTKIDDIVDYYLNGVNETGYTNPRTAGMVDERYETVIALRAMSKISGSTDMIKNMDPKLRSDIYGILQSIHAQNKELNLRQYDTNGATLNHKVGEYKVDYDGHMMKDEHDAIYEYKLINEYDMKSGKYSSQEDWQVIVEPNDKGNVLGVVARERLDASNTPGVGLNKDRFNNGFYMDEADSKKLEGKLAQMNTDAQRQFLLDNNLVQSGSRFRLKISEEVKVKKLKMRQSAAHSLVRTFVHNKELIEMQAVRDMVMHHATTKVTSVEQLNDIAKMAQKNVYKAPKDQEVLPMFLKLDMEYESYDALPVWIKRRYSPPTNVSTINGFNKEITLVRTSVKDELLGHPNFSLFGEKGPRTLGKVEKWYKELVVMAKQKMVITNPEKLAMDALSNVGVLAMKDVNVFDMRRGFTDGMKYYKDFSGLRSQLVEQKLRMRMGDDSAVKKAKVIEDKIKRHPFYDAYQAGFVQSYSTSLMVKEFDTLSGLQSDIDAVIESLTKTKKGKPNEVFKAIKVWQELGGEKGLTVDALLKSASELSKVNGTDIGTEMKNMASRLERNRKDPDSVARYVNEVIGGPASEIVKVGGAVMVTMDVLSKYTLATAILGKPVDGITNKDVEELRAIDQKIVAEKDKKKKEALEAEYVALSRKLYPEAKHNPREGRPYTKEEAYREANNTFIDYRRNLPQEIKVLSDYGILMFPSFWLKAQKVIVNLVHYHPATAIGGYMVADMLDVSNASFIDVNLINKLSDGTVINDPTNVVGWEALSPFIGLLK